MSDADLTQRVYREFGPGPLSSDQEDLYVDLAAVRGDMDAVRRLAKRIRYAEGAPTCQVLAGHNGSGKSTELFRLKRQLETNDSPLFVVYVTAKKGDLNDIDFPDLLILLVQQMAAQLKEDAGITLAPGYFGKRLERLKEILTSEINFNSFELASDLGKIGGEIKGSPNARSRIRELLEPDTGNLLNAANDVIGEAVAKLNKKGKKGIVILMDDLDKMVVRQHSTGCGTDEYLFVNRAAQLTAFRCHVVYTIPISLAYSHHESMISSNYGGDVPVVPMTKVAKRPPESGPDESGMGKFAEIIELRLKKAQTTKDEVFENDDVRNELISLSGGQPTELMTLVREAIITDDLPITKETLKRAVVEGCREYARQLRADHWPIINQIRKDGNYIRTSQTEPVFRELLNSRAILQYVNDGIWYGLNPMVAKLTPPDKDIALP